MSYEIPRGQISLVAQAAIDKTQKWAPVKVGTADDTFALCEAGDAAVGFVQRECRLNEAGQIVTAGVTFARAGAEVAAGDLVEADGSAGVITQADGAAIGIALNAATQAGDIISVLIGKGE